MEAVHSKVSSPVVELFVMKWVIGFLDLLISLVLALLSQQNYGGYMRDCNWHRNMGMDAFKWKQNPWK